MEYQAGDVISIRFAGVLRHYGVVTSSGTVISNSNKHGGVIEQSLTAFSDGRSIHKHARPSSHHGFEVEARARHAKGASYDLSGSNCIDLVRHTHRRKPTPWQVGKAAMMAISDMSKRR